MSDPRRPGEVFDEFAEEYDARRSGYPRELVEQAVELARLEPGSRVVEVGCGTGKLTQELVACGLDVDAIDPGANMIDVARRRVGRPEQVRFHLGRFEDVALPDGPFDAVFSATAFHWVDPSLGWQRAASLLRPGGTMALIDAVSVRGEDDGPASAELVATFNRLVPGNAAARPADRDIATIRNGADARRGNASELWAWLAHPGRETPTAATLFGSASLTYVTRVVEQTAAGLWALFETTSSHQGLSEPVRDELRAETERIIDRYGSILRSTQLVALVSSQRLQAEPG